jgi:hypothetical protein
MTEPSRRLAAASGLRRPSVTCSPGSEREVNSIARPVRFDDTAGAFLLAPIFGGLAAMDHGGRA